MRIKNLAFERMRKQIEAVGGQLTFLFKIDDEGWTAKCKEFDGIVTGGISKNPLEEEVMQSLIDSIKTAFDVPINKPEIGPALRRRIRQGEKEQIPTLPTIKLVREFQFC